MKKNKLYAILSSLLVLSSFSLVSCGNKSSYSSEKPNITVESEESLTGNSTNDNKTESIDKDKEESTNNNEKASVDNNKIESTNNNKESANDNKIESNNKESTNDNKVESTSDNKAESTENSKTEGINNENNNKLKYPVFNNITNTKNVNALVEQFIRKISNSHNYLDMDYKIMYQDKNFISIYFNGNINSPSLAYPSKFKATLNINIDSATQLKLNNLVNFDSNFIKKFKEALISTCNSNGFEASTVFDLENLNDLLNRADNNGTYLSDVQSYYNANQLNIILSVPHALGDYIEISLK